MELRASDLAAAVGGRLEGDDAVVDGASIDSRAVEPGQLFVPIVAARDGHEFVQAATRAGATAYLSSGALFGGCAIVVPDTGAALQAAGRHARSLLPPPIVGVTGSVGKTSVKDLLAAVLGRRLSTAASPRSFNNELGVPLTLLNAPSGTEAVVVEMGARGKGHIRALCEVARPTVGIVTRVAVAHTEAFGSIDDVARSKGELVEALPASGTAVLNADDQRVAAMAARTDATVVTYGDHGEVRAGDVELADDLRARFTLESPWGRGSVELSVRGLHQTHNALAAAAGAFACGLDLADVQAGLASAALSPWRMELHTGVSGARVINDAYNANPTSVMAALESLAALPAQRRTAVLGLMAELGDLASAEHEAIGAHARRLGIRLISVGAAGYGGDDVPSIEDAYRLLGSLDADDAVLVKGSRVAGLERLVELLVE